MTILECIKAAAYGALGALAVFFFYEGVPGAARIPYLTSVPIIGSFVAGEKHVYADEQVKAASEKMVSTATLEATQAMLYRALREAMNNRKAAEAAEAQVAAARTKEIESNERYDQAVKADTSDGATVGADDLEWLRNNGN